MSRASPGPKRRETTHPSGRRFRQEGVTEAGYATGEDEILRTGHGGLSETESAPARIQGSPFGPHRSEHVPDRELEIAASEPSHGMREGWLPVDILLTSGEALAAVLVAEAAWSAAMVVLALAERLTELQEPIASHGFGSALLFGLACGLYVSLSLRSRRLVWKRQLEGKW